MIETQTGTTSIGQVTTVMVPVADQDRAIDFYLEKLGTAIACSARSTTPRTR